jgi:hypothetical protein
MLVREKTEKGSERERESIWKNDGGREKQGEREEGEKSNLCL